MIIHHQDNVAGFAGAHTIYWPLQPLNFQRITATSGAAPVVDVGAGWPTRLVKLPDGRRAYLNERQIEELRIRLSRQKPSKRQARKIKREKPAQKEIEVLESEPIPLPVFYSFIPEAQQTDRIQAEIAEILANEEDTLTVLLMVS